MAQFNVKDFDDELYRRCRVSALDCGQTMKEWLEGALRTFLEGGTNGAMRTGRGNLGGNEIPAAPVERRAVRGVRKAKAGKEKQGTGKPCRHGLFFHEGCEA